MTQWKDTTTYRRGDTERKPTCWSLNINRRMSLTVLTGHIYNPDQWVMHFNPFLDTHDLGLPADQHTAEEAQEKALTIAKDILSKAMADLEEAGS